MTSIPSALKFVPAAVAAAVALCVDTQAQVQFTEITVIDLASTANPANAEFLGTNPSAVAWNGSQLFVSGQNNSAGASAQALPVSLVEILNPFSPTPTFGPVFGTIQNTPPVGRGYLGLDIEGTTLVASFDDGNQHPQGIAAYDLNAAQRWVKTARGSCGVAMDPGFGTGPAAPGSGVGFAQFGSGRRLLQDTQSGADIYNTTNGMIINTPEGTTWRDMDFDDATGDIWLREGNNVIHGVRSGGNTTAFMTVVFDQNPDADFIIQQNVAFCRTAAGSFVMWNDRSTSSTNQGFFQTVMVMSPNGQMLTSDWSGFSPNPGSAAYDFSFHSQSNTLALLDSFNRKVHIFAVSLVPYSQYGSGCVGSNGLTPELSGAGLGTVGSTLTYQLRNGVSNGQAFVLLGLGQGALNLYPGCDVLLAPILPFSLGPIFLDGAGAGSTTLPILAAAAGQSITAQGLFVDPTLPPFALTLSNGLRLDVP
ncbi:MAG: hypothetical protein O2865_05225 [Planctomycetota bacterium]|nr:hypothetical protein [Planctomycetota bacterium]